MLELTPGDIVKMPIVRTLIEVDEIVRGGFVGIWLIGSSLFDGNPSEVDSMLLLDFHWERDIKHGKPVRHLYEPGDEYQVVGRMVNGVAIFDNEYASWKWV